MVKYGKVTIKSSDSQSIKLKSAVENQTRITLRTEYENIEWKPNTTSTSQHGKKHDDEFFFKTICQLI